MKVQNEVVTGPDGLRREKLNCPFYPACYIMGDCSEGDWKRSECGLDGAIKTARREKRRVERELSVARFQLGEKLKTYAKQGKLDDLLEKE